MEHNRDALRRLEIMLQSTHHPCDRSELGHQIKKYREEMEHNNKKLSAYEY